MGEWSYGRLRIQMNKAFDIGVESLSRNGGAGDVGLDSTSCGQCGDTVHSDKFDTSGRVNLAGGVAPAHADVAAAAKRFGDTANGGTFFLETFGCQMNDHDSEKVAGLLLRRGYRQTASPAEARLVLYNTCSIREKAEQKVFSRLGLFNPKNNLLDASNKIIGILGCVAQQEGERIFERAPWVSLVCGSASYSKLPVLLAEIDAGQRS